MATATGIVAVVAERTAAAGGRRVSPRVLVGATSGCVLAILLALLAVVSTVEDSGPPAAGRPGASTAPLHPVQDVPSYRLVSSDEFCPTADKVDLDTARSGHGGQVQLGDYLGTCRVDGGLAELVLEPEELHGPDNDPLFHLLDRNAAAEPGECHDVTREIDRLRNRISLDELRGGDVLCVRTDQGNSARVTVLDLSRADEAELTIAFTTWR